MATNSKKKSTGRPKQTPGKPGVTRTVRRYPCGGKIKK